MRVTNTNSSRPPSLSEWIAAALTRDIILGAIAPGSQLREAEIAERFHTSRGPCREAFSILTRRGLLETAPYRATIVRGLDQQEVRRVSECRRLLDPAIAAMAAERADDAERQHMRDLCTQALTAAKAGNRPAFYEAVRDFRTVLVAATHNVFLAQIAETINHQTDLLRFVGLRSAEGLLWRAERMAEIVDQVIAGDGEQAAALMRAGIDEAERTALE